MLHPCATVYHLPKRLTNSNCYNLFLQKPLVVCYWYFFKNDVISNAYSEALCNAEKFCLIEMNNLDIKQLHRRES